jgi:serine-type D-Ala-D-Ala carboxypeptidase/endopeptidase (penicillin-binding protein 4)
LRTLLHCASFLLLAAAPAAAQITALGAPASSLEAELRSILRGQPGGGEHALLVVSLERGDTLAALQPHLPLSPASNAKLYSTAAALHYLGPDFRFATYLLADGEIVDGVLHGDLYLYGTGDPSLSDRLLPSGRRALAALADTLRALGVHEVRGAVIGDGSYFGEALRPPSWDPAHATARYAPSVGALSFGGNLELRAVGGGQVQQVPAGDPALLGARAFREILASRGVRVTGGTRTLYAPARSPMLPQGGPRPGVRMMAVHHSPSLRELARFTNHTSDNLTAEALTRTLGKVVGGDPSFHSGARVVNGFMTQVVGADLEGVALLDGSGLSRGNRASAAATVRLLAHMQAGEQGEIFRESLPGAALPGGLRRMAGTLAAHNARAKTGTLRGVSALSGYVRSADGELLAFSIIANGVDSTAAAKQLEDRVVVRLASFRRGLAGPPPATAR